MSGERGAVAWTSRDSVGRCRGAHHCMLTGAVRGGHAAGGAEPTSSLRYATWTSITAYPKLRPASYFSVAPKRLALFNCALLKAPLTRASLRPHPRAWGSCAASVSVEVEPQAQLYI